MIAWGVDEVVWGGTLDQVGQNERYNILAEVANKMTMGSMTIQNTNAPETSDASQILLYHVAILVHFAGLRDESSA